MTKSKNLWLADRIIEAYRANGFVSAIIFGKQGTGKTTYALKTARDVFATIMNKDKNDVWNLVEAHTVLDLQKAVPIIRDAVQTGQKVPVIIFDDASIWLSKYIWYKKYMLKLYRLYAIMRNIVAGVIFTTPSPNDIALFLREKGWYQIKVTWKNKKDKIALAQLYTKSLYRNNSGQFVEKHKYKAIDEYKVELPNAIYQRHIQTRLEIEARLINELASELEKEGNFTLDNGG